MPTSIQSVSSDPEIFSFWAGASARTSRPVADFLASLVQVQTSIGFFKQRNKDARLVDNDFSRPLGSEAAQVDISLQNQQFNCTPFGMDYILDKVLGTDLAPTVKDGINLLGNLQAESTERNVIRTAIQAAGNGTAETFTGNADPVSIIDALILSLMKAGASQKVGILFDPVAWGIFKNNASVIARTKGDISFESAPGLFQGNSEFRTAYAFYDANPLGAAANVQFVMPASTVLLFTRPDGPAPDRNDPSFIKRFALDPELFRSVTGHAPIDALETQDGRKIRVVCDWSEDIQVTNMGGSILLNVS